VKAPTLIIYGRYDRMCSYEIGLTILNYVADSRIVVLNDCGHWPPYEKPEEYNAYVEAFLKLPA
jgi:pimeloyl-ACP methyl ester carboxylesterase